MRYQSAKQVLVNLRRNICDTKAPTGLSEFEENQVRYQSAQQVLVNLRRHICDTKAPNMPW